MQPSAEPAGDSLVPGVEATARGRQWTVQSSTRFEDCTEVRLSASDGEGGPARLVLLSPFDRIEPRASEPRLRVVRPRAWLPVVQGLALEAHPLGGLRAAARSRIELLPYQLEPALAVARGESRLLVADEVGLGKTIQAALIVAEVQACDPHTRALIVTPAGLRVQWKRELEAHFGIDAALADAAWLQANARALPADVNPWVLPGVYLASFDFLKRPEVLRAVEDLTWDVLVVDEAHNASPGTARGAAIHAVASRARRVILLTATPHNGDPTQFESLCRLGDHSAAPRPVLVFNRTRRDAGIRSERRTALLVVRLSAAERRMHRLLERYTDEIWREAGPRLDGSARLAAVVLRKRALSSAASLAASVARRRQLLAGEAIVAEQQLRLPLDEDPLPDEEPDAILATPGLADAPRERAILATLAEVATRAAARESKLETLARFLRRAAEPAIIFTEYRDTLARIQCRLEAEGLPCLLLHGAQSPSDRDAAQQAFNRGRSVLLATDAAAEGLNLHARCRLVIHFELPWSPSRLEQRTGRIDRIGQRRRVHQVLLVARATAERLVLAPLVRRAACAHAAGTGGSRLPDILSDARVAEAVMDGRPLDAVPGPALRHLPRRGDTDRSRGDATIECARLGLLRDWSCTAARQRGTRGRAGTPVSCRPGHIGLSSLFCVYRLILVTSSERAVHRSMHVVHDRGAAGAFPARREGGGSSRHRPTARDVRDAALHWGRTREPGIRAALAAAIDPDLATREAAYRESLERLAEREAGLFRTVGSTARRLVQAGLFDSRAVTAARVRQRVGAELLEDVAAHQASLALDSALTRRLEPVAFLWSDPKL